MAYGTLDTNVVYERGQFLDQWTIMYNNNQTDEKALIKIRKSDSEIIEFDVELAPLPTLEQQSKDIVVSWKMFNGFATNKTFFSDSNSLEMIKRQLQTYEAPEYTIAGNFYPINSAIAMRSKNSNLQVTVMNDRA